MKPWKQQRASRPRPTSNDPGDEFGRAIASWLSDAERDLSGGIVERLRAGRCRAIANRKVAPEPVRQALAWPRLFISLESSRRWIRIASVAPLVLLIAGLVLIKGELDDRAAQMEADVDAQLLTDVLPPSAYVDAGFREFLRPGHRRTAIHPNPLEPGAVKTVGQHA